MEYDSAGTGPLQARSSWDSFYSSPTSVPGRVGASRDGELTGPLGWQVHEAAGLSTSRGLCMNKRSVGTSQPDPCNR